MEIANILCYDIIIIELLKSLMVSHVSQRLYFTSDLRCAMLPDYTVTFIRLTHFSLFEEFARITK